MAGDCQSESVGRGKARIERTVQPLPMDQPTTPQALPRARTSSGKISAGYSHGTVNHVAPKMAVKRNTKNMAPPPTPEVLVPLAFAL